MKELLPPGSRILAVVSGLLLAAACPPVGFYPLAWVGLLPLFISLEHPQKNGIGEGAAAGFAFNVGVLYWLAFNDGTHPFIATITMIASVVIMVIGWTMAAWLFVHLRRVLGFRAWLLAPFSWVAWEGFLGHMGELAFPWPVLALTQADFLPVLQMMEFTGFYGVSFWVVTVNVALLFLFVRTEEKTKRIAVVLLVSMVLIPVLISFHVRRYSEKELPTARVMVVQGNIPARVKWIKGAAFSWSIYDSLTRAGVSDSLNLVVWPETALPVHLRQQSMYINMLTGLANSIDTPILTGASDYERQDDEHRPLNSAFLTMPQQGLTERCVKRFLVPFGERVPFQALFPIAGKLNFGQAEFLPGRRSVIFEVPSDDASISFPVAICFESVFPQLSREAVQQDANLLVTISNDAWYGKSSEYHQIAALSRFRCIETRRSLARAANTGISLLVDHLGRVIISTELFTEAQISADLPLCDVKTFYIKHGNVFLMIVTAVYGLMLTWVAVVGKDM
ncbi:MAG: apolipoprotein N-acyltransferase [Calditrichaeota bacterium]|nr:apolipoprotein N-acyltransferase [Calditrichota bacterium]